MDTFLNEQGTGVPSDTAGYGGLEQPDTTGMTDTTSMTAPDTSGWADTTSATGTDTSGTSGWSDTTGTRASLIADDNHVPTTANDTKIRLLNGLSTQGVPLTLYVNFFPYGEGT